MTAYRMAVSGMGLTFQNAAYSTFVKTKERPLFIMPGGKATSTTFCTVQGRAKARPAARFHAAAARPHEHRHLRRSHPDGVYVR